MSIMFLKITILLVFVSILKLSCSNLVDIKVSETNLCWKGNDTIKQNRYCRVDANFYWKVNLTLEITDDDRKAYCCAHHQYYHCAEQVVRKSNDCKNETEVNEILDQYAQSKNTLNLACGEKYKNGSWKCEFPLWATLLCLIGFILGFGVLSYVMFGVFRIQG